MTNTTEKTANQLFKESNTSLTFKEWIAREKEKGIFIKNAALASIIGSAKDDLDVNQKPVVDKNKIFGISKNAISISIAIVAVGICISYYQKHK